MARTTLDIDDLILREIKKLHEQNGRSMGKIASQLLAEALASRQSNESVRPFKWHSKDLGAKVDLSDKDAVYAILDREG